MPDRGPPRPPRSTDLTIAILTRNEGRRLPGCLAAIPPRYPVVVVDSGSSDATLDIATQAGCRVFANAWAGFAAQRNFCLQSCGITSPWVLFVDADEVYPAAFYRWFEAEVAGRSDRAPFEVAMVASRLIFKGRELRFAPGYPIYHPRLVRRGAVSFLPNQAGHGETVDAAARVITVDIPYRHAFYDGDLIGWMQKHIELGRQEIAAAGPGKAARDAHWTLRARISQGLRHGFGRVLLRFLYHYVVRGGFRDGRAGFEYSAMYSWYEATKWLMATQPDRTQAPVTNAES
jgi:glycosyltransferase involved in cell wall biosynthesis